MMSHEKCYCFYCGRLRHRCACSQAGSDLNRFLARGGRAYKPRTRAAPYKRGVPPQVKRRERLALQRHHSAWHQHLTSQQGERCANCDGESQLVLDHILPIAKGGLSQLDNLQLLCAECNRLKGKLVFDCRATHRKTKVAR